MSTNTIFVILALIIAIALVIYLVAIKKGKSQTSSGVASTRIPEPPKKEDEDNL
ncbi:hypothetical protein KKE19_02925 [Patescibacteria group bacterium]|nr:hypothetical protein [Patescibacteria group bacterium]MBU4367812.1 hypothetical protein [Patescibacteria group bacterium]MBU4461522.1 hypothetical protein [Patescibacteria group bacterium]MCG2700337.1 hypothetical protein [Candidatus Parcubacteria bacterium]